jgi:hypothetical protein
LVLCIEHALILRSASASQSLWRNLTLALATDREASRLFSEISSDQPDRPQLGECRGTRGTQTSEYRSQSGRALSAPERLLFDTLDIAFGDGGTCCTPLSGGSVAELSVTGSSQNGAVMKAAWNFRRPAAVQFCSHPKEINAALAAQDRTAGHEATGLLGCVGDLCGLLRRDTTPGGLDFDISCALASRPRLSGGRRVLRDIISNDSTGSTMDEPVTGSRSSRRSKADSQQAQ